jgi:tetratricopeptide (TPR) repeat protein
MKHLLEGLFLHDIVLMILGILLFLVLLIGMIIYFFRKEPFGKLLFFFFIPIVMIGYPSIQKISFSSEMIEFEKNKQQVAQNPQDSTAKEALKESLEEIQHRRVRSPEGLASIGEAYVMLGNYQKAEKFADSALSQSPNLQKAKEVKSVVELEENLKKVEQNTADPQTEANVRKNLQVLEQLPTESVLRTQTLSQAYEKLGDTTKARRYAQAARRMKLDNQARQLQDP